MTAKEYVAETKSRIAYAPRKAEHHPNLVGWRVLCDDSEVVLCAGCAARILARGFLLNGSPGMVPMAVWLDDPYDLCGPCVCCEGGCQT